jgi:deazaflavin-dependent oxidoreductase (nitroreductase family)
VPHDLVLKGMNLVHRGIITLSFGRLGWHGLGMPVLELTTTGRRSGEPRSVMLTTPLQEGDDVVIVASRGGDDHHPAWFLNLRDDPHVEVAVQGGPRRPMVARIAEGEERERLWAQLSTRHTNSAGYPRRSDREIPVVVLSPPAGP